MQAIARVVPQEEEAPKNIADRMRALLVRCRSALESSDAAWERDVETAAASDAQLVLEIDAALS